MRTRVGYSGGTTKNPIYHSIGDHAETTEVDFDPSKITYTQILDLFWKSHNPCAKSYSRQYMSAIFTRNEEQKRIARESQAREEKARGPIKTEIAPFTEFTLAEDYHQKYYLQQHDALMRDFRAIYPNFADFVNSTAAARVNGYVDGGPAEQLRAELPALGLSPEASRQLLGLVR